MPDLTGMPVLDVAIGLVFVFWLLSVLCSAINEAIASLFAWRANTLEQAIRNLLDDPKGGEGTNRAKDFYDHPQIRALSKKPEKAFADRRLPSYISPRAFVAALFDTIVPSEQGRNPWDDVRDSIGQIQEPTIKAKLTSLLNDAQDDVAVFRANVETWFDETMERATGWYRRRVQIAIWVIAFGVAFGSNADALQISTRLWSDDAVRTAIVVRAQAAVAQGSAPGEGNAQGQAGAQARGGAAQPRPGPTDEQLQAIADRVAQVKQLELPMGWSEANRPDDLGGWVSKLGGLLLTTIALSLGAPFWFDVLNRFSRLKGAGSQPAAPGNGTGGSAPPGRDQQRRAGTGQPGGGGAQPGGRSVRAPRPRA